MEPDLLKRIQEFDTSAVKPLVDADGVRVFDPFLPCDEPAVDESGDTLAFAPVEFAPDDLEYDASKRIEIARFLAHGASQQSAPRGRLKVSFTVDAEFKYDAVAATDWPGVVLEVVVLRPLLPSEMRGGERRVSTGQLLQAVRAITEAPEARSA